MIHGWILDRVLLVDGSWFMTTGLSIGIRKTSWYKIQVARFIIAFFIIQTA